MPIFWKKIFGSAVALKRYNDVTLSFKSSLYIFLVLACLSFNHIYGMSVKKANHNEVILQSEEQKAVVLSSSSSPLKGKGEPVLGEEKLLWSLTKDLKVQSTAPQINRDGAFERKSLASRSANLTDMRRKEPVAVASKSGNFEAVSVIATGYTAGRESTGKSPDHPSYGITYSGIKVHRDADAVSTVAADPKVFPIGTLLYIPDYGYGIVADTGSAIKGHKIDLYYHSVEDVYNEWGKKKVEVYVIEKGDGKLSEETFNAWKQQVKAGTVMKPILE